MKKEIEHGTDGTELELEGGYNESRIYELGFHIDPELPQEEVKKVYQGIREGLGTVIAEGEPQKIPLAYTISRSETGGRRDFNSAYFAWIAYEAGTEAHTAVLEAARANKSLIRFIDVRTDAEAAKHAAEMHEIYAKLGEKEEGQTAEEEVSDTELDAALKDAGV